MHRNRAQDTIELTDEQVRALAQEALEETFALEIDGYQYTSAHIWDVLLVASAKRQMIEGTADEMEEAPSGSTVRKYLNQQLLKGTDLKQLENFQQFGLQLETELTGKIKKELIYAFRVELMYPLYTSIDTELSGFDLLNTDISFKLGLKLGKWASLDYLFGAKRLPLIVDQWQLVNNLVLSITANIL